MLRLLFVDDDDTLRRVMSQELSELGFEVRDCARPEEALAAVRAAAPDVALLDLRLPGMSGIQLMEALRAIVPDLPTVMLTGHGAIQEAVEAMRRGAYDFLTKPAPLERLRSTLELAHRYREVLRDNERLRRLVERDSEQGEILGTSAAMLELRRMIERVAPGEANVLILGESGTGKELVARAIHAASPRSERPFVVVNCGALPEGLVASELFGHEKGAFTGAGARRTGLLEAAHGGTVFLDEIGELPVQIQPALLRAIQFGEIQPVGSERARRVDVRILAATHRDPMLGIEEGWFREDLFYRLAAIQLEIPPLRERAEDVELLAASLLARATAARVPAWSFDAEALAALRNHDWPGNVRELQNAIMRLATLATGPELRARDVERFVFSRRRESRGELPTLDLQELERLAVLEAMRRHRGNKPAAAAELGVALKTVYNKLARFGIERDEY